MAPGIFGPWVRCSMACGRGSAAVCSCLGLLQRSCSGFCTREVLSGWMVCGRRWIPGRGRLHRSLPAATAWHRAQEHPDSQPIPVLEAGDGHKCDSSCIYPVLLIHRTRIITPAVARAGFNSGGSRRGVGAVVPDPISAQ